MAEKNIHHVDLILDRIKKAYGMSKDVELADFLGRAQNTISAWRRRNTFDYELIITKCDDLNLHWVMFGTEPVFRKDLMSHPDNGRQHDGQYSSEYEHYVSNIVQKLEDRPFSQSLKLQVINSLLEIVDDNSDSNHNLTDSIGSADDS